MEPAIRLARWGPASCLFGPFVSRHRRSFDPHRAWSAALACLRDGWHSVRTSWCGQGWSDVRSETPGDEIRGFPSVQPRPPGCLREAWRFLDAWSASTCGVWSVFFSQRRHDTKSVPETPAGVADNPDAPPLSIFTGVGGGKTGLGSAQSRAARGWNARQAISGPCEKPGVRAQYVSGGRLAGMGL